MVKPNAKIKQYQALKGLSSIEPPIWLAIMANKYENPLIVDAEALDLTMEETVEKIKKLNPTKVVLLAIGSHPSSFVQQRDSVKELASLLKGIEVETHYKLNINPIICGNPRWDLLDMSLYRSHNWHSWTNYGSTSGYGVNYTSISCPFRCNFCVVKDFYGDKYQERPINDIMKDFDVLADNYCVNIKLMDELFIYNKNRVKMICDEIINTGYNFNIWTYARIDIMTSQILEIMRKAGIRWLAYGIESGNDDIRKGALKGNFNKDKIRDVIKMTSDYGICSLGNYMFGFEDDDMDTMKETLDFAKELNCEYSNFYCTVNYKKEAKDSNQFAQMGENFKPSPTKYLKAEEVLKFRDNAFMNYFTDEGYLNSMNHKFGMGIVDNIKQMTDIKLIRK